MGKVLTPEVQAPNDPGHILRHELIARLLNELYGVATYSPAAGATVNPDVGLGGTHVVTLPSSGVATIGPATTSDSTAIQQWQAGQLVDVVLVQGGSATVTWDASWGLGWQPDAVAGQHAAFRFRNVGASGASGPTWQLVGTSCLSGAGSLAARPGAGVVPAGFLYFASNDNGGTVYRSDGVATWTAITAGMSTATGTELGFTELTTNSATTSTATAALTGLASTVVVGSRPILVEAYLPLLSSSVTAALLLVSIYEGANELNRWCAIAENAAWFTTAYVRARLAPSAGSHTYQVMWSTSGGTATAYASNAGGGTEYKPHIQVRQV